MIICDSIIYEYGGKRALDELSMTVNDGEFLVILGHNGSGKSTLAKHFNALLLPYAGTVSVDGVSTCDEERLFDIRSSVGLVFQNPDNQMVTTIIEEDVAFAPENLALPREQIRERVDWALSAVDMLKYKDGATTQLSGGQKQRVAIAGILAMKPKYIVLDEPTAMLDPVGRCEVLGTLKKLNDEGITIIMITHNMEEAVIADRVMVMQKGKITLCGTPREVFSQKDVIKDAGLTMPMITKFMQRLTEAGVSVRADVLTDEEAMEELNKI